MKEKYYRRIRMILNSEFNAGNRIKAIDTLAVPVVTSVLRAILCKKQTKWKMKNFANPPPPPAPPIQICTQVDIQDGHY